MYERMMTGLRMLAATAVWVSATTHSQGKEDKANVEELKARRDTIIEDFRLNYWQLDPYLRARAIIDRAGMLEPRGKVVMNSGRNGTAKGGEFSDVAI
jgi:hypothetical protein